MKEVSSRDIGVYDDSEEKGCLTNHYRIELKRGTNGRTRSLERQAENAERVVDESEEGEWAYAIICRTSVSVKQLARASKRKDELQTVKRNRQRMNEQQWDKTTSEEAQ